MTNQKQQALLALLLLVPVPTLGVLIAMYWLPGTLGQIIFSFCKFWVLVLPLLWTLKVDQVKLKIPKLNMSGMLIGVILTVLIMAVIFTAYQLANYFNWFDITLLVNNMQEIGLATPKLFIVAALYWCLVNALLEEYVWRWFVFSKCVQIMPSFVAVLAASSFFTLHHIFALAAYFNWQLVILCSIGVFSGGVIWSWLYLKYRNIYSPYFSHVLVDVLIFVIGYRLIFG